MASIPLKDPNYHYTCVRHFPIAKENKLKLGQLKLEVVRTLLRITRLTHRKSYLIIICPNSHEKLTKSEIMSSLSRFKHFSESLV